MIWLSVPNTGWVTSAAIGGLMQASTRAQVTIDAPPSSALTYNFNRSWVQALNEKPRPEAFAMHHADVAAPPGWIDAFAAIMLAEDADIVSAVIPIKNREGLTSTAFLRETEKGRQTRRLTIKELAKLPDTFDAERAGFPGCHMLINTGLWLARLDRPWAEDVCFDIENRIYRNPDGSFGAYFFSEDWKFGEWASRKGLKVVATKAIEVRHYDGGTPFRNRGEWGRLDEDGWFTDLAGGVPVPEAAE